MNLDLVFKTYQKNPNAISGNFIHGSFSSTALHPFFNSGLDEVIESINQTFRGEFKSDVVPCFGFYFNDGTSSLHAAAKLNKCTVIDFSLVEKENLCPFAVSKGSSLPKNYKITCNEKSCLFAGRAYIINPIHLESNTRLGFYMIAHIDEVSKFYNDFVSEEYSNRVIETFKGEEWVYISSTNCERVTPSSKQESIHLLNPIDYPFTPYNYLISRALLQAEVIKPISFKDLGLLAELASVLG